MAGKKKKAQNRGLSQYQKFMRARRREGMTQKQALKAWKKHKREKRGSTRAPKAQPVMYGPVFPAALRKRRQEQAEIEEFQRKLARVERRNRAQARLDRMRAAKARAEQEKKWEQEAMGASWRDPGGKKKGKKKSKKGKKTSPWTRFVKKNYARVYAAVMRKHPKSSGAKLRSLTMKRLGVEYRKSGASKRDPGWFKHPRLHAKASRKGWRRGHRGF